MIIGIGNSPLADFIKRELENIQHEIYPYPLFFDDKKLLLSNKQGYIQYLKKLIRLHNIVKVALWPDYIPYERASKIVNLDLLKRIMFVVPIHSLKDIEIGRELEARSFVVFYGYASDKKYRDYELNDFLKETEGKKRWYLGVSTKHELKEALVHKFDGFDITGFLFGTHKDRKNPEIMKKKITEMLKEINKKQLSLIDFC